MERFCPRIVPESESSSRDQRWTSEVYDVQDQKENRKLVCLCSRVLRKTKNLKNCHFFLEFGDIDDQPAQDMHELILAGSESNPPEQTDQSVIMKLADSLATAI